MLLYAALVLGTIQLTVQHYIFLLGLALFIILSGHATRYVVNIWAPLIKYRPNQISLCKATLLGIFVSSFTIPFAIVTKIIMKLKTRRKNER